MNATPATGAMPNIVHSWYTRVVSYFSGYPQWAVDVALFGSIGFAIGFVAKLFRNIFLILTLGIGALIFVLQAYMIIQIDVAHLQALLGISDAHSITELLSTGVHWAQEHIAATLSFLLGFIAGWKVG